ncbi:MAG: hypothetical protein IJ727_08990 [Treponema sp.]|nr:hypothetical protein [Treponema sp.]
MFKKIKNFIALLRRIDKRLEAIEQNEKKILAQLTDTQIRVHDVQDRCYDLLAKSNAFLIRKL